MNPAPTATTLRLLVKGALFILACALGALGSALLLTAAGGDEGLNIYAGSFGSVLISPVATLVAVVLLVRGRIVASASLFGVALFFVALLELTSVGLYLRHRSNMRHAKTVAEEIVVRLDNYEREHGAFPRDLTRALANWHNPYSYLLSHGPSWTRNVSIHYSSDECSYELLVCPPMSTELGVQLAVPVPEISLSSLRPVVLTSTLPAWANAEMNQCRNLAPAGHE